MKKTYQKLFTTLILISSFIFLCGANGCNIYAISGTVDGDIQSGVTITLSGDLTTTTTTSSDGSYILDWLANGRYTITPSKNGYTFDPASEIITVSDNYITGVDFTGTMIPLTSLISGTVSGDIQEGVIITLSGDNSDTTTSDSNGDYSFGGITDGNYTITPTLSGYTFSPTSQNVTVSGADESGIDFDATENTYTISGTVTGDVQSGVTITLSGDDSDTTTTDLNGDYFFGGITNGNYTILPSLSDYTFSPTSENVTVSDADETGVDFTSTEVIYTYTLGGTVYGDIQSGVTMTLSGDNSGSTTTDLNGDYSFAGLVNGSYTVTPSLSDYTFSPTSEIVTVSDSAETGVDFTATEIIYTYAISGTVSGDIQSGVTITLSGDNSGSTTTDSDGDYSFAGLVNGSYTVTPSLSDYTFSPTSEIVTVSDSAETGVDFTATGQGTDTSIEMVSISGGTFQMGCAPGEMECFSDELPCHSVTLSSFEIGKYEVTQGQWEEVMGNNPSNFYPCGDNCPVERVSWNDTQTFITELNSQTGQSYRLCTEAEWEYAARAGTETKWYCGNDESCVDDIAWYDSNSGSKTHPVGQKSPNAWGLYDMSGNVWEWVEDWYDTYSSGSVTNPTGPVSSSSRVDRGGSWLGSARYCRSTIRYNYYPSRVIYNLGFRLCSGVNFETYTISGTVSGDVQSGITMTLSGDNSGVTTTDSNGDYRFTGLENSSYLVTPGKSGYTFSPASESVTVSDADETGVDFTASEVVVAGDRFVDNGDGTVTDQRTGLLWLKNASCYGAQDWYNAMSSAAGLNYGECGLTDGSEESDWRLPTKDELQGIGTDPPTTWDPGPSVVTWTKPGSPFVSVQSYFYWSCTEYNIYHAWSVAMSSGYAYYTNRGSYYYYIWPVRSEN